MDAKAFFRLLEKFKRTGSSELRQQLMCEMYHRWQSRLAYALTSFFNDPHLIENLVSSFFGKLSSADLTNNDWQSETDIAVWLAEKADRWVCGEIAWRVLIGANHVITRHGCERFVDEILTGALDPDHGAGLSCDEKIALLGWLSGQNNWQIAEEIGCSGTAARLNLYYARTKVGQWLDKTYF